MPGFILHMGLERSVFASFARPLLMISYFACVICAIVNGAVIVSYVDLFGTSREVAKGPLDRRDIVTKLGDVMLRQPKDVIIIYGTPKIDMMLSSLDGSSIARVQVYRTNIDSSSGADESYVSFQKWYVGEGRPGGSICQHGMRYIASHEGRWRGSLVLPNCVEKDKTVSSDVRNLIDARDGWGHEGALDCDNRLPANAGLDDCYKHDNSGYSSVSYSSYGSSPYPYAFYSLVFFLLGTAGFLLVKKGVAKAEQPSDSLIVAGWLLLLVAVMLPAFGFIFHPENALSLHRHDESRLYAPTAT